MFVGESGTAYNNHLLLYITTVKRNKNKYAANTSQQNVILEVVVLKMSPLIPSNPQVSIGFN